MDIQNSSGTGGAEDANMRNVNDESEVADDNNGGSTSNVADGSIQPQGKRGGQKVGGNSGQIATKESADNDDSVNNSGTTADGKTSMTTKGSQS